MEACVRRSDQAIVQFGQGLGPMDGCDLLQITDVQYDDACRLMKSPNGGLLLDGKTVIALPEPEPSQQQIDAQKQREQDAQSVLDAAKTDPAFAALARILGITQ